MGGGTSGVGNSISMGSLSGQTFTDIGKTIISDDQILRAMHEIRRDLDYPPKRSVKKAVYGEWSISYWYDRRVQFRKLPGKRDFVFRVEIHPKWEVEWAGWKIRTGKNV
jgi:hypothetical protein